MASDYQRRETAPRAVAWILIVSSMFWPRLFLLLFWIFDDELPRRALDTSIVPFLVFVVLPWTTITYATMWGLSSDRVAGLEWVAVGIAFLLDVGTYAGIRRVWWA